MYVSGSRSNKEISLFQKQVDIRGMVSLSFFPVHLTVDE
jgi:hypothetical protein